MRLHFLLILAAGFATALASGPARAEDGPVDAGIRQIVAADGGDPTGMLLRRFYEARSFAPAWIGQPQRIAALTAILADGPRQGLEVRVAKPAATEAARDVAFSRAALDYAAALAAGRVRPDQIEVDWAISPDGLDVATGLEGALKGDLAGWYARLAPRHPLYERLMAGLARYRAIAEAGGWPQVPRGEPLKLGAIDPRVPTLRRRLAAEGDLPAALAPGESVVVAGASAEPLRRVSASDAGVAAASDGAKPVSDDPAWVFDGAVEQAVRRFQSRHGIGVDGTAGPRTVAAMNVTVRARIHQIELNLERWRTLPHELGANYMLVNVPAERLDVIEKDLPVISMKVVVGDTQHPTPVVRTTMVAVTLNPTWTIPASIVKKELMPKTKRDPAYLQKNDIVFTPGRGWQQLPGPKNPLGHLKFESPNRFDVYLHDTPSRTAFDRYFRAQSHGCVRLERADELAGFVLQGTAWDAPQLAAAVATGENRRIDLKRRWRVYIVYATSFVDDDGTVEFRDDLYGRDARLRDALAGLGKRQEPQKQAKLGRF